MFRATALLEFLNEATHVVAYNFEANTTGLQV